jgi:cytidine deaminase
MKFAKPIIAHLISAAITGYLALNVINHPQLYKTLSTNEFSELILWTGLFLGAIVYFIVIWLVDLIISYILFRLFGEASVCGLYIEAFIDDNQRPNLSLMVVYYSLLSEQLKVAGYGFRPRDSAGTKLEPWASWESSAFHHISQRDYVDVFYLHEGDVGPTTHLKVRGTTICKLPLSHKFYQGGSFCDLANMGQADLRPVHFEIIKADRSTQKKFFDGVKGLPTRPWSLLRLAAPTQDYFCSFVDLHGRDLLAPGNEIYRGPMMSRVWGEMTAQPASATAAPVLLQAAPNVVTSGDDKAVRDALADLLKNSFAPYSNFHVAAAVVDENANTYYGVNVENQSFPVATCAEAGAISAMHRGGGKKIKRVYLLSSPNVRVVPCGACRQRLAEFSEPATPIITFHEDDHQSTFQLEELFPHGFKFK